MPARLLGDRRTPPPAPSAPPRRAARAPAPPRRRAALARRAEPQPPWRPPSLLDKPTREPHSASAPDQRTQMPHNPGGPAPTSARQGRETQKYGDGGERLVAG